MALVNQKSTILSHLVHQDVGVGAAAKFPHIIDEEVEEHFAQRWAHEAVVCAATVAATALASRAAHGEWGPCSGLAFFQKESESSLILPPPHGVVLEVALILQEVGPKPVGDLCCVCVSFSTSKATAAAYSLAV